MIRQQVERVEELALFLGEVRIGMLVHYNEEHKIMLRAHWSQLHRDFRL